MAFCIECGAKAPNIAKFCPQCGTSLADISADKANEKADLESAKTPDVVDAPSDETAEIKLDLSDETDSSLEEETQAADAAGDDIIDSAKALASSASLPQDIAEAPKSKAGLLMGLGLAALIAAGGGAYALGLFDGFEKTSTKTIIESSNTKPVETVEAPADTTETETSKTALSAYQAAIKTGRITDLGQFAADFPDHNLAKDAEAAALASLNRQKSTLAYSTFTRYFPNADLSGYTGETTETAINDQLVETPAEEIITILPETNAPSMVVSVPAIRTSISTRVEELNPFIEQGNVDYALSVIDELLGQTDINEDEATYLWNARARAETSRGFIPAETAPIAVDITPTPVELTPVEPAPIESITPPVSSETAPIEPTQMDTATAVDIPAVTIAPEIPNEPAPKFDTPAKPIERFGAITPDEATEPGECDMSFAVNSTGQPIDIIATCTQDIFIAPATETVSEWTYEPALLAGVPVQQDGLIIKIRFNLDSEE